jgi:hypothetical protein
LERGLCARDIELVIVFLKTLFGTLFGALGAGDVYLRRIFGAAGENGDVFFLDDEETGAGGDMRVGAVGQSQAEVAGLERENERGVAGENLEDAFLSGRDDETRFLAQELALEREDFELERFVGHYAFFIFSALSRASSMAPTM